MYKNKQEMILLHAVSKMFVTKIDCCEENGAGFEIQTTSVQ